MEFGNIVNLMNNELLATCSGLGYLEGDSYQKEPDALETVKDLIRFLRREDDTCEIRRQLGNAQILQNDLIYLLKQFDRQTELFETCIRLVVNLTQPAELCFGNKVPGDKTTRNFYLEVLSHLQAYKQAFADEELMVVLAKRLKKLLDMEWESRREEHTMLMERILLLVRNVLHIPTDPTQEKRTDDDASIHDQVLWALNVSGMDKLILYVASSEEEHQWCMHAVEITSLMLREQTPEQLAKAGITRASSEKQKDEQELERARQREVAEKKARALKGSARHSRFGGTFYVKNFKSISERDVIFHQAPQNAKTISFDREKQPKKRAKNRMPMKDTSVTRRSTLSIRLFLKEFCELFLDNCYNPLMHAVKDHILHQKAQENDDTYYLWAMRFFMEFSRHYHFRIDVISETFSVQAFYYVQNNINKFLDMMITDKKEFAQWSRRLHYAMKAYRELVATLDAMTNAKDPKIRESARVIQSNIFYVIEYREIFVGLLKKFDDVKNTKSFLVDLVETTHIFIKMLEKYCKGKNTILVQKKGRKKNKKRKQNNQPAQNGPNEEELEDKWDQVTSDLSAMLQGREDIPENVVPFDAASEQPVEEQRADAMVRIQRSMRNGQSGDAIALLRAAREVWPEGDIFGANDISPEDEFMSLREIHFTNLNVAPMEEPGVPEFEEDEEDEMAEMEREVRGEEEFDLKAYLLKFSHPDIIRCYVSVLQEYRKNTVFTNHCAVKMLHRISFDQGDGPLLYQLSLFRVFQKLLNDPVSKLEQYKELKKFSKYVVGKFFEIAAKNNKMFLEMLFWKSRQDLYELEEGYGAHRPNAKTGNAWREDEIEEVRELHEKYKNSIEEDDDADVVDKIMEHITDETRTRKQIINQLVELGLAMSVTDFKRKRPGWKANLWREEQEMELKILYDRYKDADDPLGEISENISHKRSKPKLADKLISLGCVETKNQLYKKRRGKKHDGEGGGRRRRRKKHEDDDDMREDMSENEEDRDFVERGSDDNIDSEAQESEGSSSYDDDGEDEDGSGGLSLDSLVSKLTKQGLTEQLKWIQDGLYSTATDREEDDDDQSIPLVPLAEESEQAMTKKLFKQFLTKVGIVPPATHEEMFWRIPGTLSIADLRSAADSIKQAIEKQNQDSEQEKKKMENPRYKKLAELAASRAKDGEDGKNGRSKRRSRPQRMQKDEALRRIQDGEASSGDDFRIPDGGDSDDSDKEEASGQRSQSRIKRSLQSDSSSNSEDDEFSMRTLAKKKQDKAKKKTTNPSKRSRLMSSDDDSDDQDMDQQGSQQSTKSKPSQNGSLQSSLNSTTKPASSDSDSDKEDDLPKKSKSSSSKSKTSKKAAASESDSDDSDLPSSRKSSAKTSTSKKSTKKAAASESDSDESDLSSSIKSSAKTPSSKKATSRLDSSDSEDDLPSTNKSSSKPSNKNNTSALESDSDSDAPLNKTKSSTQRSGAGNKSSSKPSNKNNTSALDSDSDSDSDAPLNKTKSSTQRSGTGNKSGSDEEMEVDDPSQSHSESDSDDDLPLGKVVKKRHMIESDSDDD